MADDNKWIWAAGGYALGNANSKHTTEHTIEIRDHHHYHEVKPDVPADVEWRKDIEKYFAYASDAASLAEAEMLLHPKVQAIRYYTEIRGKIEHDYKLMGVHKADLIALIDKYTEIILKSAKLEKKPNSNKRNKIVEKCKNEIEGLFNDGLGDIATLESIINRYDEMDNLLPYNFFLTEAKRLELSNLIDQYREKITEIKEEKLEEQHAIVLRAEQAKQKEQILGKWFIAFCLFGFFYCMEYSCRTSFILVAIVISIFVLIFLVDKLRSLRRRRFDAIVCKRPSKIVPAGGRLEPIVTPAFQIDALELLIAWGEKKHDAMKLIRLACKKYPNIKTAEEIVPLVYRLKQENKV